MYIITIILITFSSNWLCLFIFLELNILRLLWIFTAKTNLLKPSVVTKYFLFQTINTLILIIVWLILINIRILFRISFWFIILLKIALPPFHFWVKDILKYISIKLGVILFVLQKIPLLLLIGLTLIWERTIFIIFVLITRSISIFYLINQNTLIPLLFYRSGAQRSLIILIFFLSLNIALIYIFVYILTTITIIYRFKTKFIQVINRLSKNNLIVFILILLGLPPSPLFLIKLIFFIFLNIYLLNILISVLRIRFLILPQIIYFYWAILNIYGESYITTISFKNIIKFVIITFTIFIIIYYIYILYLSFFYTVFMTF